MTSLSFTANRIKPMENARLESKRAGGSGGLGDLVYVASDGDVELADANAVSSSGLQAVAIGMVVACSGQDDEKTTFADGDPVTVCTFGRVAGFTSLTPGVLGWVSATAGDIDDTKPTGPTTYAFAAGYNYSASEFFVAPGIAAPVSGT